MPPAIAVLPRMREPMHDIVDVRRDHRRHRGDQPRLVLVVRMQHDDDVGAVRERERVARLLVAAVAAIGRMPVRRDAEAPGDRNGGVVAGIVDEQHFVDDVVRDRFVARCERLLRVIRGHDDDDLLSVQHRPARLARDRPRRRCDAWRTRPCVAAADSSIDHCRVRPAQADCRAVRIGAAWPRSSAG